jgi:hypothetical protein
MEWNGSDREEEENGGGAQRKVCYETLMLKLSVFFILCVLCVLLLCSQPQKYVM